MPGETEFKVFIAGIPHTTGPGFAKEELQSEGRYTPTSTSPLTTKSHSPAYSYMVKLKRLGSYASVYEVRTLIYIKVQVSPLRHAILLQLSALQLPLCLLQPFPALCAPRWGYHEGC